MATCSKCGASLVESKSACEFCGSKVPVATASDPPKVATKLGSLVVAQHDKHIREARGTIMAVAVLTLLAAGFLWFMLQQEIEKVKKNPMMVIDEQVVAQAKMSIAAVAVVGVIFIGLFFWAKTNPFGATLTALIIYVASTVLEVAADPQNSTRGLFIKIIIILALIRGVKSGLAYNRSRRQSV